MATINTSPTFYLAVDGVPMSTPGWRIQNLPELFSSPEILGEDIRIPGTHGERGYRRWKGAQPFTVALHVFGDADHEGNMPADPLGQIIANVNYLKTNVIEPDSSNPGTKTITRVYPAADGTPITETAPGHVGRLTIGVRAPHWWAVTFDLKLLQEFEEAS